ncbi:MAG: hypothetical protein A2297_02650 [Elusimicrobia bacterium RIFOXYB2_FULL_48_7]|nr:MAG: hypothetical protein A2297_02650 [Elusimicrobia bacterium RIFOXYB2_FULL_48_7]
MNKHIIAAVSYLICIFLSSCSTLDVKEEIKPKLEKRVYLQLIDSYDTKIESRKFMHVINNQDNKNIQIGDSLGEIQEYPIVMSKQYDENIQKSKKEYENENFEWAANALSEAYKKEPDNPFIQYYYARALYRTQNGRIKSFDIYRKLIEKIDNENQEEGILVIDEWFIEAYWKLATIYLDYEKWDEAIYEMTRFYLGSGGMTSSALEEQLLSYLTEAYYSKGDYQLSQYYAKKTLNKNPANRYVKEYIDKIEKLGVKNISIYEYDSKVP